MFIFEMIQHFLHSNGLPNEIHISTSCKVALDALGGYVMERRGLVEMKGKGQQVSHVKNKFTS